MSYNGRLSFVLQGNNCMCPKELRNYHLVKTFKAIQKKLGEVISVDRRNMDKEVLEYKHSVMNVEQHKP